MVHTVSKTGFVSGTERDVPSVWVRQGLTTKSVFCRCFLRWRFALVLTIAWQLIATPGTVSGMPASPHPFDVQQSDGTAITLHIRGDEYFHWLEDVNGFTVVESNGVYSYATLDSQQNLRPSDWQVGAVDPISVGLSPKTLPSPEARQQRQQILSQIAASDAGGSAIAGGVTGSTKNIVIMMRFADHLDRTLPSNPDMDVLFNAVGGDPSLAPSGSVRDVYFENSYGQLSLDSTVFGWVDLPQTEAYYADGVSGLGSRIRIAIRDALQAADSLIDFSQFDQDGNNFVDAIAFIHSGYGAEWGGFNSADRIWSHRWSIPTWTSDEGVRVSAYHISPGLWGSGGGSAIGRIGVICHETGHFFGLPDLYDTNGNGSGIGSYGMMANSWGFDGSQLHPPHFGAHSKIALGWVTPTVIGPGTYQAREAEFNPDVFRIDSGFPSGEYLLIENRQPVGVESIMPQGGLCIWHIDEAKCCNTDQGYPGQVGWPSNNSHYRIALLQADGDYDLERNNNRGDGGDVYHLGGIRAINTTTTPNTNSYKFGNVVDTGVIINGISTAGSVMNFTFVGAPPEPAVPTPESNSTIRYLSFETPPPAPVGLDEILRITVLSLDGFPVPSPNVYFVGSPVSAPEESMSQPGLTFTAAPLQCEPYAHPWSTEGVLSVFGAEIVPSSSYVVQRASGACPDLALDSCWSDPLALNTAYFGDVVADFWPAPLQPDFRDIEAYIGKFLGNAGAPLKAVAQLQPNVVNPLVPIDFKDINMVVQGFLGTSFASFDFITGSCTCPSSVVCDSVACTSNLVCGSGRCVDGHCKDACDRCRP